MGTRLDDDMELVAAAELVVDSGLEEHTRFPAGIGLDIGPGIAVAKMLAVDAEAVAQLQRQAELQVDIQGSRVDAQAGVQVDVGPQVHSQAAVSYVV